MTTTLIKHGTLITAAECIEADLLIEGEQIRLIGRQLEMTADEIVDAAGKYVLPGGIDVHTHLDMPLGNLRAADDFESGTMAAACGGTTTIIDYAAHAHGERMEQGLTNWFRKADGKAVVDYGFHLTLSEFTAHTLPDMARMVAAGVTSFKVFTAYPGRLMLADGAILKVLRRAEELGGLVCVHAENGAAIQTLIEDALAAGQTAPRYHALTRPADLEGEAVHRVITLAK